MKFIGIFTECYLQNADKIFLPEVEIDNNIIFFKIKRNHQKSIRNNNHYFQNNASKKSNWLQYIKL